MKMLDDLRDWLDVEERGGASVVRIDAVRDHLRRQPPHLAAVCAPNQLTEELHQARQWLHAVARGRATREVHADISSYLAAVREAS